jgi:hypothetical protein
MLIDPTELIGLAVGKLSMSPTDVLLVFCPEGWESHHIGAFQGWMRTLHPDINMLFLTENAKAAIVDSEFGKQLKMLDTIDCTTPQ